MTPVPVWEICVNIVGATRPREREGEGREGRGGGREVVCRRYVVGLSDNYGIVSKYQYSTFFCVFFTIV